MMLPDAFAAAPADQCTENSEGRQASAGWTIRTCPSNGYAAGGRRTTIAFEPLICLPVRAQV